jgi:NADP-dependent 3-hydroxy acid dehydrogenase YdfG
MPEDPVLLITGASSGIGAATARRAAQAGYRLVLGARREDRVRDLAAELGGEERAVGVRCDVAEWEDDQALAERGLDAFGRIDAVFANAGFGAKRGFLEESPEHWQAMVLTNVLGVALTIRATLPHVLERGTGHYVLTSSVAGRRTLPGSLYSATKWAVSAMGEALRSELRQMHENNGIRVTLIEPGMTDTDFFSERPKDALADDDIARAVLFALSEPEHVDVNQLLIRPASQPG